MSGLTTTLTLAGLLFTMGDQDPAAAFQGANEQYLHGDAEGAIRVYQELCDQGFAGTSLYYNLGNAYYRAGQIGRAVASYQRALRLSPGDAEVRHNLEVARAGVVDKIVGVRAEPFLDRMLARISSSVAVALFATPWLVLWILLIVRRRSYGIFQSFCTAGAIAAALLATGAGGLLAAKAHAEQTPLAVVIAKTSPVREGAGASDRSEVEIHEGTTVRVIGTQGDFFRVRLQNGIEGWVMKGQLTVI